MWIATIGRDAPRWGAAAVRGTVEAVLHGNAATGFGVVRLRTACGQAVRALGSLAERLRKVVGDVGEPRAAERAAARARAAAGSAQPPCD